MESESKWFYTRDGQRQGPMALEELRGLLASGQIQANALVWSAGMAKWTPVAEVPQLASDIPAQPTPAVPLAYYTSAMGIPQRAMENLQGCAAPRGDTGDWPLDDQRISQFQHTVKIRARVTGAAKLYRLLLLLTAIAATVVLIGGLFKFADGNRRAQSDGRQMLITGVVCAGIAVLHYFAARATMQAHRWAPLTMFILFLIPLAIYLVSFFLVMATDNEQDVWAVLVGILFGIFLETVFAVVSWRSFAAIPRYLAQPAWCQELIVKAKL